MNTLSWLIYLADVIPKLGEVLFGVGLLLLIGSASAAIMYFINYGDGARLGSRKEFKWTIIPGSILLLFGCLAPSKDTFYFIAGSEVGEEVLKSEAAKKTMTLVNNWLDEKLKEVTEK